MNYENNSNIPMNSNSFSTSSNEINLNILMRSSIDSSNRMLPPSNPYPSRTYPNQSTQPYYNPNNTHPYSIQPGYSNSANYDNRNPVSNYPAKNYPNNYPNTMGPRNYNPPTNNYYAPNNYMNQPNYVGNTYGQPNIHMNPRGNIMPGNMPPNRPIYNTPYNPNSGPGSGYNNIIYPQTNSPISPYSSYVPPPMNNMNTMNYNTNYNLIE
jgi:hypothetical protein